MISSVSSWADETTAPTQAGLITVETAAKLLMVSPVRVRQLVKDGYIPKPSRNSYPLVGVVQGYIRFLKDEERRTSKTATANRVGEARAVEIELRTAERAHRLIETDEAIAVVDDILGTFKAEMAGIPARVTRDVALRRKLKTEIDGAFTRATARFEQSASAVRARDPPGRRLFYAARLMALVAWPVLPGVERCADDRLAPLLGLRLDPDMGDLAPGSVVRSLRPRSAVGRPAAGCAKTPYCDPRAIEQAQPAVCGRKPAANICWPLRARDERPQGVANGHGLLVGGEMPAVRNQDALEVHKSRVAQTIEVGLKFTAVGVPSEVEYRRRNRRASDRRVVLRVLLEGTIPVEIRFEAVRGGVGLDVESPQVW